MQCGHTLSQAQCRKTYDAALADEISYWKRVIHGMGALDSVQESSYISYVAGVSALSMFVIYMARSSMIWYDVIRYGRVQPSFSLHALMLSLMAI